MAMLIRTPIVALICGFDAAVLSLDTAIIKTKGHENITPAQVLALMVLIGNKL